MTGSYQLDGSLWPKNPLTKRWSTSPVGKHGNRAQILTTIWRFSVNFGTLNTLGESEFFNRRFRTGGLYNAVLPHPDTKQLMLFTGVSIDTYDFELSDVDSDSYAESAAMTLGVDLRATGSA